MIYYILWYLQAITEIIKNTTTRKTSFLVTFLWWNPQDSSLPQNVDEETTLIHISEPINILDRIDIRGIFSANTTDEMMTVDAFGPENIVFKKI